MNYKILKPETCKKYGYEYTENKAKQKIILKLINASERYGYSEAISDFAQDMDKKYFKDHPEAKEYTRPVIKGEHPELVGKIRVIQIMPGLRVRQGIYTDKQPEQTVN